ncbi:hypothetical protein U1Q18_017218 [Sarracenia purpurea var. burkii]
MPLWKKSVTHDSPLTGSTNHWILWSVAAVEFNLQPQFLKPNLNPLCFEPFTPVHIPEVTVEKREDANVTLGNRAPSLEEKPLQILATKKSVKMAEPKSTKPRRFQPPGYSSRRREDQGRDPQENAKAGFGCTFGL